MAQIKESDSTVEIPSASVNKTPTLITTTIPRKSLPSSASRAALINEHDSAKSDEVRNLEERIKALEARVLVLSGGNN
jgi:hypothetical protein